jgi:GrpB-like predicted nucleotidyltransferase (UPF0157 family)
VSPGLPCGVAPQLAQRIHARGFNTRRALGLFPQCTHFLKDGDDPSRTDHAGHLGNASCRFWNKEKENDQRHGGGIKSVVGEWKCHRVALAKFRDLRAKPFARELDLLR